MLDTNTLFCFTSLRILFMFNFQTFRRFEASQTPGLVAIGFNLVGYFGYQNSLGGFLSLFRHVGVCFVLDSERALDQAFCISIQQSN
jgi:hypothetical protein